MTQQELLTLKENRAATIKEMRALNDSVKAEERNFTAEEAAKFDRMASEERNLKNQIDAEEREQTLKGFDTEAPVQTAESRDSTPEAAETRNFENYLKTGEKRDLSVGANGGALAPEQFVKRIIEAVEKETPILSKVTKFTLNQTATLGAPKLASDASDAAWTSEVPSSITADTAMAYAKRDLNPNALVKLIKISDKLTKTSALPIETIVRNKVAKKIAEAFENGILNGTGSGQPLGLFVADANGISSARDVKCASATALDADTFIKAKMNVRQAYRRDAEWIMSSEVLAQALLLKDSNGQYIWRQGLTANEPDTLLGRPVIESEFAPSTIATGSYVAVLGDLSHYWWAIVNQIEVTVLKELYAEQNLIGYKGLAYADGAPVLEEAFTRVVMA